MPVCLYVLQACQGKIFTNYPRGLCNEHAGFEFQDVGPEVYQKKNALHVSKVEIIFFYC